MNLKEYEILKWKNIYLIQLLYPIVLSGKVLKVCLMLDIYLFLSGQQIWRLSKTTKNDFNDSQRHNTQQMDERWILIYRRYMHADHLIRWENYREDHIILNLYILIRRKSNYFLYLHYLVYSSYFFIHYVSTYVLKSSIYFRCFIIIILLLIFLHRYS